MMEILTASAVIGLLYLAFTRSEARTSERQEAKLGSLPSKVDTWRKIRRDFTRKPQ